jgi:ABC-2 type transport system permease protein
MMIRSVGLHALFNLGLNLVVVFVFVFASGIEPRLSWQQLPLLIALLVVLAVGAAMLLSALYVHYRDMDPIWEVALPGALLRVPGFLRDRDDA